MRSLLLLLMSYLATALCTTSVLGQKNLHSADHQTQETQRESLSVDQRQEHDDHQAAARYWYESRNPKNLPAMDEALAKVMPIALRQSEWITEPPSWEKAHHTQAYHDAGAILLAKCYTLLYYGDVKQAQESLRLVHEKFPHSLMLYPSRMVVLVRKNIRYHLHACMLYHAISTRKMDQFEFPPELDEYDGWAQPRAAEDMAMLRLREGDFESLDHLAAQARKRQLKTVSGQWVSDYVYSGMHPPENERWAATAWDEMGERIQQWRKKKPDSVDARIGELIYTLYRMRGMVDEPEKLKLAKFSVEQMIQEIGPICPQVSFIKLLVNIHEEKSFKSTANIFHEANKRYPDYPNLSFFMLVRLADEKDGLVLCGATLNFIGESKHNEQLALSLLPVSTSLKAIKDITQNVKIAILRNSIYRALEMYPHSLSLRNRLGMIALYAGQDDVAMDIMSKVGSKWDKELWKNQESEAIRLTEKRHVSKAPAVKMTSI